LRCRCFRSAAAQRRFLRLSEKDGGFCAGRVDRVGSQLPEFRPEAGANRDLQAPRSRSVGDQGAMREMPMTRAIPVTILATDCGRGPPGCRSRELRHAYRSGTYRLSCPRKNKHKADRQSALQTWRSAAHQSPHTTRLETWVDITWSRTSYRSTFASPAAEVISGGSGTRANPASTGSTSIAST